MQDCDSANGSLKETLQGAKDAGLDIKNEEPGLTYTQDSSKKWIPVRVLRVKDTDSEDSGFEEQFDAAYLKSCDHIKCIRNDDSEPILRIQHGRVRFLARTRLELKTERLGTLLRSFVANSAYSRCFCYYYSRVDALYTSIICY